jgi:hypothetical protein
MKDREAFNERAAEAVPAGDTYYVRGPNLARRGTRRIAIQSHVAATEAMKGDFYDEILEVGRPVLILSGGGPEPMMVRETT